MGRLAETSHDESAPGARPRGCCACIAIRADERSVAADPAAAVASADFAPLNAAAERTGTMSKSAIRRLRPSVLAALASLVFISATAEAGSFQVNPIRVDLGKGASTAAITVRNDGDAPVVVQASVMAWTQSDGQDAYS